MSEQELQASVERAYEILGNHRAVAKNMGIPICLVMYLLHMMSWELYLKCS